MEEDETGNTEMTEVPAGTTYLDAQIQAFLEQQNISSHQ